MRRGRNRKREAALFRQFAEIRETTALAVWPLRSLSVASLRKPIRSDFHLRRRSGLPGGSFRQPVLANCIRCPLPKRELPSILDERFLDTVIAGKGDRR